MNLEHVVLDLLQLRLQRQHQRQGRHRDQFRQQSDDGVHVRDGVCGACELCVEQVGDDDGAGRVIPRCLIVRADLNPRRQQLLEAIQLEVFRLDQQA